MLLMILMAAVSVAMIYTGMELHLKMKKGAFAFIYIAISIFILGVISFAKSGLGFNVGLATSVVYTLMLSAVASVFIIKSCDTSYIVGRY